MAAAVIHMRFVFCFKPNPMLCSFLANKDKNRACQVAYSELQNCDESKWL